MTRQTRPFWTEGMSSQQRHARLCELFHEHLGSDDGSSSVYVFVPDPPTNEFGSTVDGLQVQALAWGSAGKAAVASDLESAMRLAPAMFELWSDKLFVLRFAETQFNAHALRAAIEHVLSGTPMLDPPNFAMAKFDWGDLVVEEG